MLATDLDTFLSAILTSLHGFLPSRLWQSTWATGKRWQLDFWAFWDWLITVVIIKHCHVFSYGIMGWESIEFPQKTRNWGS